MSITSTSDRPVLVVLGAGPGLGMLASAALRNYALTLHAALAPEGIYAGTITVGGLIERGDIHRTLTADPNGFAA